MIHQTCKHNLTFCNATNNTNFYPFKPLNQTRKTITYTKHLLTSILTVNIFVPQKTICGRPLMGDLSGQPPALLFALRRGDRLRGDEERRIGQVQRIRLCDVRRSGQRDGRSPERAAHTRRKVTETSISRWGFSIASLLVFCRTIDPKPCNPRTLQKPKKGGGYPKVFLGGLPSNVTETDLRTFFTRFGKVMEVVIMYDQEKKKSRGELLSICFSIRKFLNLSEFLLITINV